MDAAPALWDKVYAAALEKGALDGLDSALIRALSARLSDPEDEAFRIVIACLSATAGAGGLRIPAEAEKLAARLADFLGGLLAGEDAGPVSRTEAARVAAEFSRRKADGAYAAVLGRAGEFKPLLESDGGLYFQKHHAAEASVGDRLARFLSAPDLAAGGDGLGNILDTVLHKLPLRSRGPGSAPMEFDPRQQEALSKALRKRLVVVSGGPGTGKTSLAANLLRAWTRAWLARPTSPGPEPARDRGEADPRFEDPRLGSARDRGGSKRNIPEPALDPDRLPRIRLAAPTGRAAQRLAESLQRSVQSIGPAMEAAGAESIDAFVGALPGGTLHSLLRYNPGSGEFFYGKERPLPADLVLVDEVSMVDIFTLARLLEALEEEACLVLLGDMDQLPSVEAGAVLADLVPDAATDAHPLRDHLVILDRSHRSEAGILEAARRINAMDGAGALRVINVTDPFTYRGCRLLAPATGTASATLSATLSTKEAADFRKGWDGWLETWVDRQYLSHHEGMPQGASYESIVQGLSACGSAEALLRRTPELEAVFARLEGARILAFTRLGWHGSVRANRCIHERLARRWDRAYEAAHHGGREEAFHGSPILILENDASKGLFNGDVGVYLRLNGSAFACFRAGGRSGAGYRVFAAPFLPRHESAFAMTVHKSQGSEYDEVLVVLPEAGNRLLYKETLYTALTRARRFAGVYGPAETFLEAAGRKVVRESGLAAHLQNARRM